ncbi:chitin disaccharide deacetylase [Bacillus lacus]|uniref:Chitin disaccharide deacetylase n=1 Tax=Metabacillus lacus TaxID=1983721 RepID=A0A7X2IXQ7_9BACI|nr:chitin disaccharide deacetylase [Metabacillus lacus]MRX71594.1 chitin disaccharide deacetylase [Metabacillus lacus]
MITLLVNADDFGYSRAVNYGIIDSHTNGIVNSATMMMNMPGTSHAISLAKQFPSLRIGIHLVLTCGRPLLHKNTSLTDTEGEFNSLQQLLEKQALNVEEVYTEWKAQIDKAFSCGILPTHLDSHHHVHGLIELDPVVKELSEKYDLPFRCTREYSEGVKSTTDYFFHDFYAEGVSEAYFKSLAERVPAGSSVEIMCHPGYLDHHVLTGSSYTIDRVKEVDVLTKVVLPEDILLI